MRERTWLYSDRFEFFFQGGNMPFSQQEADPFPFLDNFINAIIMKDIPGIANITVNKIHIIKQMANFISKSEIDGINSTMVY